MMTGIASVTIIYIGYLAVLYLTQNKLIFIGAKPNHLTYKKLEVLSENILSDKIKLQGWHFSGAQAEGNSVVIFFGGNAQDVAHMVPYLKRLNTSSIYTFNYRKYGLSEGRPDETVLCCDAMNIYNHVKHNNPGKQVIIIGQSLGTAIAGYLSTKKKAAKLILISPLSSIYKIAREKFFYTFPKQLIKNNLNLYHYAKSISADTLVITAKNDTVIHPRHSKDTYKQIQSNKALIEISDAGHNDLFDTEDTLIAINRFLQNN